MATITDQKLTISHDHNKKLAKPVVKCKVRFTDLELCLMKNCPKHKMFKLKCQLWAADSSVGEWWFGGDDHLYTYSTVHYFPDPTPSASEDRTFSVTLGEGVLDEDWIGQDEIYGKLILQNLLAGTSVTRKTNVVRHSF